MASSSDSPPIWQHLLFSNTATGDVISAFRTVLEKHGFASYDPFPGGSGSPIGKLTRIRAFASPPSENWQSLFIAPNDYFDVSLLNSLSTTLNTSFLDLCLLSSEDYQITVYQSATAEADLSALLPFLKSGLTITDLEAAPSEAMSFASKSANQADLPPELQQFADQQGVEAKHINKLMGRMSKHIFKKIEHQSGDPSASTHEQAKAMLSGQAQDALNTPAGHKLIAIMSCLTVSEDWYLPDWKSLVAAYPIARQLQKGHALLLPGDEASLKQVPNALDYTPLYYAKRIAQQISRV